VSRRQALVRKELLDASRNLGALVPVVVVALVSLFLPFLIAVIVPAVAGEPLAEDPDMVKVSAAVGGVFGSELGTEARIQFFLFQQFLLLFLLLPITGAMAIAAHSIVGEKQARTLEALLATPITTFELLIAKLIGALLPTLAISAAGVVLYLVGVALFAEPGVMRAMLSARTAMVLGVLGPGSALVSLQLALLVSSRSNDARTAQQFGVLIILPLTGLVVAQLTGSVSLSPSKIALVGVALFGLWMLLMLISIALFERETILTRWK
jgi:ABC-2 type transport system permease protein